RSTGDAPLQLRWGSTWQDRVTLYVMRADGRIARTGITSATTSPHLLLGAEIAVPLPAGDSPAVAILAHVEGAANVRGIMLSPKIEPVADNQARMLALTAFYAACGGLGFALLIYN